MNVVKALSMIHRHLLMGSNIFAVHLGVWRRWGSNICGAF